MLVFFIRTTKANKYANRKMALNAPIQALPSSVSVRIRSCLFGYEHPFAFISTAPVWTSALFTTRNWVVIYENVKWKTKLSNSFPTFALHE